MKEQQSFRQELRHQLKQRRASLTAEEQKEISKEIATNIISLPIFQKAKKIAFYLAVNSEADPAKTQSISGTRQKQFYLPVLSENKTQGLSFAPLTSDTQFTPNQFNILEPNCSMEELIIGKDLDLVLVPLVGFDRYGNRLGMGGGYYDRSFAFKNTQPSANAKPTLIGYAYSFQEVNELSTESWDVKLDYIATEKGIINVTYK